MKADALLQRFGIDIDGETDSAGYVAFCPVHEADGAGHEPSLRVDFTRDEDAEGPRAAWGTYARVLCRSRGCSAADIFAAVGLTARDARHVSDAPAIRPTRAAAGAGVSVAALAAAASSARHWAAALAEDPSAYPDAVAEFARRGLDLDGLNADDLERLGVGVDERNRPVYVARNSDGSVAYWQARNPDDARHRWDGAPNPRGGSWRLAGWIGAGSPNTRASGVQGTDAPVLVTEGPGDGLTAALTGRWSVLAVRGAANGAAGVQPYAADLEGTHVIICGDADGAGRGFNRAVRRALNGVAASVRTAALPDGAGDLTEWAAADPTGWADALERDAKIPPRGNSEIPPGGNSEIPPGGDSEIPPGTDSEIPPGTDSEDRDQDRWTGARLVDYVLDHYTVGTDQGRPVAVPTAPGVPRVAVPVRDLAGGLRVMLHGHRVTMGRETVTAALETVAAYAENEGPLTPALRARERRGSVDIDLADAAGTTVTVTRDGWAPAPAGHGTDTIWRRTRATMPLPVPVPGGTRDELRALLGLEDGDRRFLLVYGWLVGAFFESTSRPVLWVTGTMGSGKSSRVRMLVNLIDPTEGLGKEPGRNERDDFTSVQARFVPTFDNVTTISKATSDFICRLVTGVTNDHRALYTDGDLHAVSLRRTAAATSLSLPHGLQDDALQRLVLVELERMPDDARLTERALWAAYEDARPRVLGALLDDVSGVLNNLDAARAMGGGARMLDHLTHLRALDLHAGYGQGDGFAAAYLAAVNDSMVARAEDDALTAAVVALVARCEGTWEGSAADLLDVLEVDRPLDPRAGWPTSASSLSAALVRHSESLAAAGVTVTRKRTGRARTIALSGDVGADPAPAAGVGAGSPIRLP